MKPTKIIWFFTAIHFGFLQGFTFVFCSKLFFSSEATGHSALGSAMTSSDPGMLFVLCPIAEVHVHFTVS